MNNIDIQRTEHSILELLSDLLVKGQIKDPHIGREISFVRVKLAKDMSSAIVWVSSYGSEKQLASAVKALNSRAWEIQRAIAKRLHRKRTPKMRFSVDTSIRQAEEIMNNIENLQIE